MTEGKFEEIALVYMVAGLSSRFQGRIKQFAKVGKNNETLIEYSLSQALKAGFSKIIFIVGKMTEKPFKEKFKNNYQGIPVFYAFQNYDEKERDKPWGTVDALCSTKDIVNCPFVVCNGDDIYGENTFKILVEHLKNNKENATIGYNLIEVLPENAGGNRAIFDLDKNYVKSLKEVFNIRKDDLKATNTKSDDLCSMNIFALHPETLAMLNSQLVAFKEKNKVDRKIECLLPVEISKLIEEKKIKMRFYPTKDKWFGVTNPEDEEVVRSIIAGS